jgi:membrane protein required for colicin V production
MGALPSWLNPFDVLILFALAAGAAFGFVRGLVRTALSLVVLYVAAVLAMTIHTRIGTYVNYMSGLPIQAAEGVSFLLILILVAALLNFLLRRAYKDTELPGLRQVDQLVGMVVGFFVGCIWIGFSILVIAFVLGAPAVDPGGLRLNILDFFQTSNLIPIFYRFLPIALATLKPWMPQGIPPELFELRL